ATGERLWKSELEEREGNGQWGLPSGRGVIVGADYLLPLQSGHLVRLSLETGDTVSVQGPVREGHPLGNLILDEGRLVSLTPFEIRSFEDRAAVSPESSLAVVPPLEPEVAVRTARLQFLEGDFREVHETLKRIDFSA